MFQHTAARRRLDLMYDGYVEKGNVSTHSRPKAAGPNTTKAIGIIYSFNTQPPEGGWPLKALKTNIAEIVSTHSRPKAAGNCMAIRDRFSRFQHTAARRRLEKTGITHITTITFQHTAARRRLGCRRCNSCLFRYGFNTQPPEGGWDTT